ncbi:unnamed protein product [Amoebophrya sp. A120]|nr:unnamed protein product [Amoebophrya sp. A120]|eukprot:GSA120T00015398001.1
MQCNFIRILTISNLVASCMRNASAEPPGGPKRTQHAVPEQQVSNSNSGDFAAPAGPSFAHPPAVADGNPLLAIQREVWGMLSEQEKNECRALPEDRKKKMLEKKYRDLVMAGKMPSPAQYKAAAAASKQPSGGTQAVGRRGEQSISVAATPVVVLANQSGSGTLNRYNMPSSSMNTATTATVPVVGVLPEPASLAAASGGTPLAVSSASSFGQQVAQQESALLRQQQMQHRAPSQQPAIHSHAPLGFVGTAASSSSSSVRPGRPAHLGVHAEEQAAKVRRLSSARAPGDASARAAAETHGILRHHAPQPFALQDPRKNSNLHPSRLQNAGNMRLQRGAFLNGISHNLGAAGGHLLVSTSAIGLAARSPYEPWVAEEFLVRHEERVKRQKHFVQEEPRRPISKSQLLLADAERVGVAGSHAGEAVAYDTSCLTDMRQKQLRGILPGESFDEDAALEVLVFLAQSVATLLEDIRIAAMHSSRNYLSVADFDFACRYIHCGEPPTRVPKLLGSTPLLGSTVSAPAVPRGRPMKHEKRLLTRAAATRRISRWTSQRLLDYHQTKAAVRILMQNVHNYCSSDETGEEALRLLLRNAESVFYMPEFEHFADLFVQDIVLPYLCRRRMVSVGVRWQMAGLLTTLLARFPQVRDEAVGGLLSFIDCAAEDRKAYSSGHAAPAPSLHWDEQDTEGRKVRRRLEHRRVNGKAALLSLSRSENQLPVVSKDVDSEQDEDHGAVDHIGTDDEELDDSDSDGLSADGDEENLSLRDEAGQATTTITAMNIEVDSGANPIADFLPGPISGSATVKTLEEEAEEAILTFGNMNIMTVQKGRDDPAGDLDDSLDEELGQVEVDKEDLLFFGSSDEQVQGAMWGLILCGVAVERLAGVPCLAGEVESCNHLLRTVHRRSHSQYEYVARKAAESSDYDTLSLMIL